MGVSIGGSLGPVSIRKNIRMPKATPTTDAQREAGHIGFAFSTAIFVPLYLLANYPVLGALTVWGMVRLIQSYRNGPIRERLDAQQAAKEAAKEAADRLGRRFATDVFGVTDEEIIECVSLQDKGFFDGFLGSMKARQAREPHPHQAHVISIVQQVYDEKF